MRAGAPEPSVKLSREAEEPRPSSPATQLLVLATLAPAIGKANAIVYVPLDDRPVTRQLPEMLGRIAGVRVAEPPRAMLGSYLTFGQPGAILAWLDSDAPKEASDYVLSADMMAYGGLVASRVPGVTYADAYFRLRALGQVKRKAGAGSRLSVFGTIMRLAPTGVPADAKFFAPYPVWTYLQQYANLHDPPLPSEVEPAAKLRAQAGPAALDAYLATRYRNYAVDRYLIDLTGSGTIDRLVLGQDDAGPVGLHVREVAALQSAAAPLGDRASVEPGADELGMALVAAALARNARWVPRIAVRYSRPDGASVQDPLEFAPVDATINALIRLSGGVRDDAGPDIVLFVRVPENASDDVALSDALGHRIAAGDRIAFADLSFVAGDEAGQARFADAMLRGGVMNHLDSYASWNTTANSVGTALAEAIAAGAGRRLGTYDDLAHREFTFDRIVDDVAFRNDVRPDINASLPAGADRTLLQPDVAAQISARNRALLWNRADAILEQLYPGYHIASMQISLPWDRTFETEIRAALAPDL